VTITREGQNRAFTITVGNSRIASGDRAGDDYLVPVLALTGSDSSTL
jgi:hypothetical protein